MTPLFTPSWSPVSSHPAELRGRMYAELAQYVAPKRKSVEMSAPPEGAAAVFGLAKTLRERRQAREPEQTKLAETTGEGPPPDAPGGWVS